MRILDRSARRLMLEDRPWLLAIILLLAILLPLFLTLATWQQSPWLGFAMLLMAGLFALAFVIFVRRVTVIFDRDAGTVLIRTKSLLGQSQSIHSLTELAHAEVETTVNRSTSSSGRNLISRTHRTVLQIAGTPVPLTPDSSAGDGAERMAREINDWLGQ